MFLKLWLLQTKRFIVSKTYNAVLTTLTTIMETIRILVSYLTQPSEIIKQNQTRIIDSCKHLCSEYENNSDATIGDNQSGDPLKPLLTAICESVLPAEVRFLLVKVLKILLRKELNRTSLGKNGIVSIVKCMALANSERHHLLCAEVCNLVLNAIYDGRNVQFFVEAEGIPILFAFLDSREERVQSSALGAIQGVCYVPNGRKQIRSSKKVFNF